MSTAPRRAIVAWTLYDFANSAYVAVIPATVYSKYYALAVVGNDRGEGDFWWGLAVTTAMAIVALSSPPLGAIADLAGVRKRFLLAGTAACVAATALMATVRPGDVLWGWFLAVVATVAFEGALVYYNAYLPALAPPGRQGRLSGYGFALGYLGSAVALGAALPLAMAGNYGGTFLLTAAIFAVFAVPALVYLPADRPSGASLRQAAREGLARSRATLLRIVRVPPLRRFLLAYLLYEDGVNTVVFFSAVFAGHTLGFTTPEVIQLYFVVQLAALAGAWAWARPTDTRGPKFVVVCTLVQWCLVVAGSSFVETKGQFFAVAVVAGTALGAVQAASRAFMSSLIPRGEEAEFFGFYALCGKTASVLGPLVFGLASRLAGGNQRAAILAVGIFFVVGLALIAGVKAGGPAGGRQVGGPEMAPHTPQRSG